MKVSFPGHLHYVQGNGRKKCVLSSYFVQLFKKSKREAEAQRKICSACGNDAIIERVCQKWFTTFLSGYFNINDTVRCGRPTKVDSSYVKEMVKTNPSRTIRGISTSLNIPI